MSTTIEQLELEIVENSNSAISGIDALTSSLKTLKGATKGKLGLDAVAKELESFNKANIHGVTGKIMALSSAFGLLSKKLPKSNLSGYLTPIKDLPKAVEGLNKVDTTALTTKLQGLVGSLSTLSNLPKSNLGSFVTSFKTIPKAIESIQGVDTKSLFKKTLGLRIALAPLANLPKANLSSFINPLKNLPEAFNKLNSIDMSAFSAKIKELAKAMKPLADEMAKVSGGFSLLPTKMQKVLGLTNKMPKVNKNATRSFTELYHQIKMAWATLTGIGNVVGQFVKKSTDYTENLNLFTVAMGSYASDAQSYAESLENSMGIDSSAWMRSQGIFMTLATGFGVASDKASVMSQNLTQLGYDLASFRNISYEDAMLRLQSGLAGELEPLRRLGYDLSQAKLEATALALGIDKSVSSMTQAEKAQLRYYAIMTQMTEAHGDMARTLDSPANQLRILKSRIEVAGRKIGNIFIPMLNAVLPHLINMADAVGKLADKIAKFFGYEAYVPDYSDMSAPVVVTDEISDNLADAVDSAKKLKNYMMGFDELNIIDPNNDSGDSLGGWKDFDLPTYSFEGNGTEPFAPGIDIDPIVDKAVEAVKELESVQTNFSWDGLLTKIKESVDDVEEALVVGSFALGALLAFTGANVPIGIALMSAGAMKLATGLALNSKILPDEIKGVIATITTAVSASALAVGTLLAFTGANIPLGIALMGAGALSLATAIIPNWNKIPEDVKGVCSDIMGVIGSAFLVLGAIFTFTGVKLALGIGMLITGAAMMATPIVLNWGLITEMMRGTIGAITTLVSTALLALGATLLFTGAGVPLGLGLMVAGAGGLATVISANWDTFLSDLRGTVGKIIAFISGALLALGAVLLFTGAATPLGLGLLAAGAVGMGTTIAANWDNMKNTLNTVLSGILTVLSGASLVLGVILLLTGAGIPLGLGMIFAGLQGAYTAMTLDDNPITNFVKSMANKIIEVINNAISKINDVFASIGLSSVKFNLIPTFASGGFPDEGQMFIAREAGAEMVGSIGRRTAVANNDQIVGGIASGVASANEEQNALLREQNSLLRAILEKDSGVYLDGKNLANSVEKYQRERGRVLITGGVL